MHRIDGPGATVDNKFTEGDPLTGTQATVVTDDWLNDIQESLMSILAAAGIAPVKGNYTQLVSALKGRLLNTQQFLTAGTFTYTKTPGTRTIRVYGQGGGGSGAGAVATTSSQASAGGGGAAGAIGEGIYDASSISTVTVVVGAGGVVNVGGPGIAGGTSSFGTLITLPGGTGGLPGTAISSFAQQGGLGAAPSAAPSGANIIGTPGDAGESGKIFQLSSAAGGTGGKSPFGASNPLGAALGFGVGGEGGSNSASQAAKAGFAGLSGFIIVEEIA